MALGETCYWFNQGAINASAPADSGVYGIYVPKARGYVYIGQSENIQTQLTQHLGDAAHCMHGHTPLAFTVELVAGSPARSAREAALIARWNPPCNQT